MKLLRFATALLLLAALCGCSKDAAPGRALFAALSSPVELSWETGDSEFLFTWYGPGESRCSCTKGRAEGLTMVLGDGMVESGFLSLSDSRPAAALPDSCPLLQLSGSLDRFYRDAAAKEPTFDFKDSEYLLGGAVLSLAGGRVARLEAGEISAAAPANFG